MAVAVCSSFESQLSKEFLLRQMYVYHCSSIHFRSALCFYLSSYGEEFWPEKGENNISSNQSEISGVFETWMTVNKLCGAILYVFLH